MPLKRIIMHWTGGAYNPSASDRAAYHVLIDGTGRQRMGDLPPEANESTNTAYAAHTRALNTGSIGVAACAMHGARERPFSFGRYPVVPDQIAGMAETVADLCMTYDIPVERKTVLFHAEVETTLGVWQRAKWDMTWLPGMAAPTDPISAGDAMRLMVLEAIENHQWAGFTPSFFKPELLAMADRYFGPNNLEFST